MILSRQQQETQVALAFSQQSYGFDAYDTGNAIIQYKRQRVRKHVSGWLSPDSRILELNAGTGEDAVWFARQGHRVHATDIAEGMLRRLSVKIKGLELGHRISSEQCSFNQLDQLRDKGPYDLIFSNFAGLNCADDLGGVLRSFSSLLKPGGQVSLVVLPGFCLWESLLVFKGKFRTASRRWFRPQGARSRVEGHPFLCWYYSPGYVREQLGQEYQMLGLEGLCTMVPPSYIEGFAEKYPRSFRLLTQMEDRWKNRWPFNRIGDYFIVTFRKR